MSVLVRKLALILAASASALTLALAGAQTAPAKLYGSKLNRYGDGKIATRGLEKFSGAVQCQLDADGSLLASQTFPNGNPNRSSREGVRLAKLTVNGRRALKFGHKGTVKLNGFHDSGKPQFDAAHRVLIVGSRKIGGVKRLGVLRLTSRGRLDKRFGVDGFAVIPEPGSATGQFAKLRALPDGRIVVATWTYPKYVLNRLTVLTSSGAIDRDFGTNGTLDIPFAVTDVGSGGGSRLLVSGTPGDGTREAEARVVRYEASGTVDLTWGQLGTTSWFDVPQSITKLVEQRFLATREPHPDTLPLSAPRFSDVRTQILPDGKFIVVITSYLASEDKDFALDSDFIWSVRLGANGDVDPTYGTGGVSYGSDVTNRTSYMDSGDFEAVEWELLPSGRIGVWNALYGYTDEFSGAILSIQGTYDRSGDVELKYVAVDDAVFDIERKRVLLCASYKKRQSVFSLKPG